MLLRFFSTALHTLLILCSISSSATSTSLVDFSKIPDCARGVCFPYHSSSIGCPQLTTSCFCNALAPVNCASKNCTGNDWYAVEDWFATQCPTPPNVTFTALPECSRACIREGLLPDYCAAVITRNCFCRLETQFESLSSCLDGSACRETALDANDTLTKFYRDTCIYDPSADGNGGQDDSNIDQGADQVIDSPDISQGKPSTFSKFQVVIGVASGLSALLLLAIGFWVWLHRSTGGAMPGGDLLDPPPAYEPVDRARL